MITTRDQTCVEGGREKKTRVLGGEGSVVFPGGGPGGGEGGKSAVPYVMADGSFAVLARYRLVLKLTWHLRGLAPHGSALRSTCFIFCRVFGLMLDGQGTRSSLGRGGGHLGVLFIPWAKRAKKASGFKTLLREAQEKRGLAVLEAFWFIYPLFVSRCVLALIINVSRLFKPEAVFFYCGWEYFAA